MQGCGTEGLQMGAWRHRPAMKKSCPGTLQHGHGMLATLDLALPTT
jgi:hypothetical protein